MKKMLEMKKESSPNVVRVKWIDDTRFIANDDQGHSIVMDVSKEHGGGGAGFSPVQLVLIALGGCTGMDVVNVLQKQRQKLTDFEILVSGERVADYPRVYSKVHVDYRLKGQDLREKAVQRAIQLSEEKYCSVGAMIKKTAKLSHSYKLQ